MVPYSPHKLTRAWEEERKRFAIIRARVLLEAMLCVLMYLKKEQTNHCGDGYLFVVSGMKLMNYLTGNNKHLSGLQSTSFFDELRTIRSVTAITYMIL
jgi:hypothetical protein